MRYQESVMLQAPITHECATQWVSVCSLADIQPYTGVCALVNGEQIAIFRVGTETELYALSNYDPFSKANVLSRGIVGDRKGVLKVASPIYKQNFSLKTGEYLDDPTIKVPTFPVQVVEGWVQVSPKPSDN
jgi:nitrite reductase (NADH) small subunit